MRNNHFRPTHSIIFDQYNTCCVCGNQNCSESITHNKITLQQIKNQIYEHQYDQQPQLPLTSLKNQVKYKYNQLKYQICDIINQKQRQIQVWLNQFYFPRSYAKNKHFQLVKYIMENSYKSLPNKNIRKLNKQLFNANSDKSYPTSSSSFGQFDEMSQHLDVKQNQEYLEDAIRKTKQFLSSLDVKRVSEQICRKIQLVQIKQQLLPQLKLKLLPKRSISTSECSNPEEFQPLADNIFEWSEKRLKITKNTRVVQLSNKSITDQQIIQQLSIIACFKNIQEIQLRNNKISSLTCNIIANNFSFLKVVDIRSNKLIDDKGIIKIIYGVPKLKSLLISQTLATDLSGIQVSKRLPELEVFWSQQNQISGQVAIKIAQKPRIKVLSLAGNPIQQEFKQKIRRIMNPKGYVVV